MASKERKSKPETSVGRASSWFARPDFSEEKKHKARVAGGRERARLKVGHSWTRTQAKAHGIRAYLKQIALGQTFGYRAVRPVEIVLPPREPDVVAWESGVNLEDDDDIT